MNRILCGVIILAVLPVVGCGGGAEGGKPVFAAAGTVTLNGAPLAGATVAFAPTASGQPTAIGKTDNEGRFRLTTYDYGDGATEGSFKVVITKSVGGESQAGGGDDSHGDDFVDVHERVMRCSH